jgi:DNA modification methylase
MTGGIWRTPPGESTRTGHPAVMPVALAERCIRLSTWPGEVVADPFAGTGTTLVAAKRAGRRAVGIEQSKRYCEIAAGRLAQQVLSVGAGVA